MKPPPVATSIGISALVGAALFFLDQFVIPIHVGEDSVVRFMLVVGFIAGAAIGNYLVFKRRQPTKKRMRAAVIALIVTVICFFLYTSIVQSAGEVWMWIRGLLMLALGASLHAGMILAGVSIDDLGTGEGAAN